MARIGVVRRAVRVPLVLGITAAWSWTLVGPAAATASPDVTIQMVSDASGAPSVGDGLSYTLTIGNTGAVTAQGIEVQDDLPLGVRVTTLVPAFVGGRCTVVSSAGTGHPEQWSVTCTRPSLAAGASMAVTFAVRLTGGVRCGSLTNTASVAASNEPGSAFSDDHASVTDTVTCPPSIEMTKTAPDFAHAGSTIAFTMSVTNTGHADLRHVSVADPGCDSAPVLRGHGDGDATLSHGETWSYRCGHVVHPDAPDRVSTTATVRATSAAGVARASARASTSVLKPKLAVTVAPAPVSGTPRETITYRYVVRNTGNAILTSIAVEDDRLGAVGTIAQLVPGHSRTFTLDRTLAARDPWVANTAIASGDDPSGRAVTASSRALVTIVAGATTAGAGSNRGGDGTAFTGRDATLPAAAAMLLAIVGVAALLFPGRHRS
jgi:uncharacterized repeat protein (TIGR01451 family)